MNNQHFKVSILIIKVLLLNFLAYYSFDPTRLCMLVIV